MKLPLKYAGLKTTRLVLDGSTFPDLTGRTTVTGSGVVRVGSGADSGQIGLTVAGNPGVAGISLELPDPSQVRAVQVEVEGIRLEGVRPIMRAHLTDGSAVAGVLWDEAGGKSATASTESILMNGNITVARSAWSRVLWDAGDGRALVDFAGATGYVPAQFSGPLRVVLSNETKASPSYPWHTLWFRQLAVTAAWKDAGTDVVKMLDESSTPEDGTIASFVEQTESLTSAAASRHAQRRTRTLYPEDFGAVGDGITDDTAALEAWLASPSLSLRMGDGRYLTTRPLVSALPGRTILSDGGVILADMPEQVILTVTGQETRIRLTLDGQGRARCGLLVRAPQCDASGSVVRRLHSSDGFADGIRAETLGGFYCIGARISEVKLTRADETAGQNSAAHGLYLGVASGGHATAVSVIEDNIIEDISGFGGGMQIINTSPAASEPFGDMRVQVRGNTIRGFDRRAMKIQASDVTIRGNECSDSRTIAAGNEYAVIWSLNGDRVTVEDNTINVARAFPYGVYVGAVQSAIGTIDSASVQRNRVTIGGAGTGVRVLHAERSTVRGNTVYGGTYGVDVLNVSESQVTDNAGIGASNTGVRVITAKDSIVRDNTGHGCGQAGVNIASDVTGPDVSSNTASGSAAIVPATGNAASYYQAVKAAAADIPSSTATELKWETYFYGSGATYDSATGYFAPQPGVWTISATVAVTPAAASGYLSFRIMREGGFFVAQERVPITSTALQTHHVTADAEIKAGDRVRVEVYQTTGAAMKVDTSTRVGRVMLTRVA